MQDRVNILIIGHGVLVGNAGFDICCERSLRVQNLA